jgi:hypothetical protein
MTFENLPSFLMRRGVHDNSLQGTIKKAETPALLNKTGELTPAALSLYAGDEAIIPAGPGINRFFMARVSHDGRKRHPRHRQRRILTAEPGGD